MASAHSTGVCVPPATAADYVFFSQGPVFGVSAHGGCPGWWGWSTYVMVGTEDSDEPPVPSAVRRPAAAAQRAEGTHAEGRGWWRAQAESKVEAAREAWRRGGELWEQTKGNEAIFGQPEKAAREPEVGLLRLIRLEPSPHHIGHHSRLWASFEDAWARRPRDLAMLMGTLLLCALLLLWGLALSRVLFSPLLGWSLAVFTAMLLLGAAGRVALYYQPDELGMARGCFATLLALHLLYCACVYLLALDDELLAYGVRARLGSGAFQLLLLWLLGVPCAAALAYVLPEWGDLDLRDVPLAVRYALGGLLGAALLFIGLLGGLFSRTLAAACLATLGLLVVLLGAALTWRLEGYLPPRWRQAVLAAFSLVALCGALIGVTDDPARTLRGCRERKRARLSPARARPSPRQAFSEGGAAYAGFSLCSLTIAASLAAVGADALAPGSGEAWRSYHTPTLLPSYALVARGLQRADAAVEALLGALVVMLCWSAYTMLTIRPRAIGASAGAIVQAAAVHAVLHAYALPLHEPALLITS